MLNITDAYTILRKNIQKIRTVHEWSEQMGYSDPKYFARVFRRETGTGAKNALVKTRLNCLIGCILKHPENKNHWIAKEIGLNDEVVLNKYLKHYVGMTPTEFKQEVLNGGIIHV